jgi:hypothetical protein
MCLVVLLEGVDVELDIMGDGVTRREVLDLD